jgi:hypothetical protein
MVCDYFGEASGPVCRARADKGLVMPTIMEEIRYCLTARFRDCIHWQERSGSASKPVRPPRRDDAPARRSPDAARP